MNQWPADMVERRQLSSIKHYGKNARTHSPDQIAQIAASIREFGFVMPLLLDEQGELIAGHGRALAAKKLELGEVPVMVARGWSEKQIKAYRIADNQLSLNAGWDVKLLAAELGDIPDMAELVGFNERALLRIMEKGDRDDNSEFGDPDLIPPHGPNVSTTGDLWLMGEHRLLCGSSLLEADRNRLFNGIKPVCCLTDPPYGIGATSSKKNKYADYNDNEDNLATIVREIMPVVTSLCERVVLTPGNANVWRYPRPTWTLAWFTPAGIGSGPWGFCCWQPILCYGKDPKLQIGIGRYPDAIVHTEAASNLGHPCAKPVHFWEWLTERASNRGETIFEPFSGSGTTLITGTMKQNPVYAMEISPMYVDLAVRRWQDFTGKAAILDGDGRSFEDVTASRTKQDAKPAASA